MDACYEIVIFILTNHEDNVKPVSLLLLIFAVALKANAQDITWYEGSVVLANANVVKGKISVHQGYDLISVRNGDALQVYPAHKVHAVYYYDRKANINRKFTCIQQPMGNLSGYQLYEIVLSGEIRVLRHVRTASSDVEQDASGYHYYYQVHDDVVSLHRFRNRTYPAMVRACESLLPYVEQNHLDPTEPADIILIIDHYNKSRSMTGAVASSAPL